MSRRFFVGVFMAGGELHIYVDLFTDSCAAILDALDRFPSARGITVKKEAFNV